MHRAESKPSEITAVFEVIRADGSREVAATQVTRLCGGCGEYFEPVGEEKECVVCGNPVRRVLRRVFTRSK